MVFFIIFGNFFGWLLKYLNINAVSLANNHTYDFGRSGVDDTIKLLKELEDKSLVAFKYCDQKGHINDDSNPNGSSNNIAGILNEKKNILGMMPHPERLIDPLLSGEDGSILFTSLLKY